MNLQTEAQNISALLLSKYRVFAYLKDEEIEVHDRLFIDDRLLYLGTYTQQLTEDEVLEKLHFMTNKAKNLENTL